MTAELIEQVNISISQMAMARLLFK